MRTIARTLGFIFALGGYLYCVVMLWMNVIQWWGLSAVWVFFLSPILAVFLPLIAWIVEGTFPVLLLAGWGAMILGGVIAAVTNRE